MAENITAHMDKSLESLKHNFSKVRTGRANANILSDITVMVLFVLLPAGTQKSFFCLSAWRSSIIPYAGPDVNTFLQGFSGFFALTQIRFIFLDSSRKASRRRRQK